MNYAVSCINRCFTHRQHQFTDKDALLIFQIQISLIFISDQLYPFHPMTMIPPFFADVLRFLKINIFGCRIHNGYIELAVNNIYIDAEKPLCFINLAACLDRIVQQISQQYAQINIGYARLPCRSVLCDAP